MGKEGWKEKEGKRREGWTNMFSALVPAKKVAARRRRVFWNCIFVFVLRSRAKKSRWF